MSLTAAELHEVDGSAAVDVQRVKKPRARRAKLGVGPHAIARPLCFHGALVLVPQDAAEPSVRGR